MNGRGLGDIRVWEAYAMVKLVISPKPFVGEVNRRLPDHFAYEPGLRVFLVPVGAAGARASGYDWEPKTPAAPGVIADVANAVESEFEVDPRI